MKMIERLTKGKEAEEELEQLNPLRVRLISSGDNRLYENTSLCTFHLKGKVVKESEETNEILLESFRLFRKGRHGFTGC
jgi:hypothetical protein